MTTALVLAGHGSHISPNTAGIVWTLVDELRALRIADEITAAFWKEMPAFHRVLYTLNAADVTIVPLFTAQGYFTRTVIPAEMGLTGSITQRDGRTLRYARTLGEHPALKSIVFSRIKQIMEQHNLTAAQTAAAVIGHGTKRSAESRYAAEAQAAAVRASGLVAEAIAVYLDDIPDIPSIYRLTSASNLIAVPYFLAAGSHTTLDVPAELALPPGQTTGDVLGRTVYYAPPIGTDSDLCEIVLDLAYEAGMPLSPRRHGSHWDGFPAAGRDDLIEAVWSSGGMQFGQLWVSPHEVRVDSSEKYLTTLDSPARVRQRIRETPFRPLSTSADLPGGWRVEIRDPTMLHATVETVYPGKVADWSAYRRGAQSAESLVEVAGRQTGMLRELVSLDPAHQSTWATAICEACICHPTWFHGHSPAESIPCLEPCNLWMSRAKEHI